MSSNVVRRAGPDYEPAIAEVADELGVYDSTLGNGVCRHQDEQADGNGVSPDERTRIKQLGCENTKLGVERDLLK